jgi:hypothetical protein
MKSYTRLHATLPGAVLSALKARVKAGEPSTIQELWASRQYTFMSIDFEWSERNKSTCLEFGYATIRSFYLNNMYVISVSRSLCSLVDIIKAEYLAS